MQRQEAELGEEEKEAEEEIPIQAKGEDSQTPEPHPDLESRLRSLQGGGQPLSESVRAFFEPRFGYDFAKVRVHNDAQAAESSQAVKARAFTVGRDIVFSRGRYAPGTSEGKRLLAHELTHVVQQNSKVSIRRKVNTVEQAPAKKDSESTLDVFRTMAKEDALKIKKIFQDNLYLGPYNQREIMAIIRKWAEKPPEIGTARMTSFDYLIVALKMTSFQVGTIAEQFTSAFDQIFYRMSGDRVEQFKNWMYARARIFKTEKPSKMVTLSEEFKPKRLKETATEFWEQKFKDMGGYLNKIGAPTIIQNLLGGLVGVIHGFAELLIELAEGIWSLAVAVDHLMNALLYFITGALEGGGLGFLQKIPLVGKVFDPKTYQNKYDATIAFFEGIKVALKNPSKIFQGIKDAATKAWREVLEEYNKADEFNKSRIIAKGVVKVGMAVGGFIKSLPSLAKSAVKIAKTVGQLAVKAVIVIEKAIQGVARIAGKVFRGAWKVVEKTLENGAKKLRYFFKKAGTGVLEEVPAPEAKLFLTCTSPCKKTEFAKALEDYERRGGIIKKGPEHPPSTSQKIYVKEPELPPELEGLEGDVRKTKHIITAAPEPSEVLGAALEKIGDLRPGVGYEAHHIIPPGLAPEKLISKIESALGSNALNSAQNGVWLPKTGEITNEYGRIIHLKGIHAGRINNDAYIKTLQKRLMNLRTEEVAEELVKIKRELSSGSFHFMK